MTDIATHAVFIHTGALETLGAAIKPYLTDGPQGMHLLCKEIDSGGAFFEMVLDSHAADGALVEVELMIPAAMVRLVISAHSEDAFGFRHPLRSLKPDGSKTVAPTPEIEPIAIAIKPTTNSK